MRIKMESTKLEVIKIKNLKKMIMDKPIRYMNKLVLIK